MKPELVAREITIKFRNDLKVNKKGNKYGTVKTADNASYLVSQEIWDMLEPNSTHTVKFEPVDPDSQFPPWIREVVGGTAPSRPAGEKTNGGMTPVYKQAEATDKTAERIFVCGLMNGWAHAGKLPIDEDAIAKAIDMARRAFARTLNNGYTDVIPH